MYVYIYIYIYCVSCLHPPLNNSCRPCPRGARVCVGQCWHILCAVCIVQFRFVYTRLFQIERLKS